LRDKFFFDDICVYMDNLAVHRSREVKERLDELSIPYIFSPPYSPDFNPIESVFSIFKRELKVKRLAAILQGRPFNVRKTVKKTFEEIDVMKIANCISHVQDLV
jgi:transposase